jgi:3-phenylpropionate/trans-cinnamate dioxygenase ferredoxin reductase component
MQRYRHLVVGGGMTGHAACRGIADREPDASVAVVSSEQHPPYARPPLSKALWRGKDEDSIWRGTDELGVDLHLGRTITQLDLDAHTGTDDQGESYEYERLLIATGGTPRRLRDASDDVIYFRTLDDYRRLRELAQEGTHFVVIGGGFIGSEITAALTSNGCRATMVFPEAGIGARIFPADLAAFVTDYYRERGVEVLTGEGVDTVEANGDASRVHLGSGRTLDAAAVVAGLGIVANDGLASSVGLPTDDGVLVDERGRVGGRDDVFAAGDVARFPVPALGITWRVEHEDQANTHGRHVGANMAGADQPYDHLPFFYSDLFDLGYEAVGDTDPRLATLAEWAEPNRKGVVCYADDDGRPRGFLLWDVWGKVDAATELIGAGEPVDAASLRELL